MIKLKKLNGKKLVYSFVQGRFSEEVAGKFQHFPINSWEKEFPAARKLNFDTIEWIVSDYSNPIFNRLFREIISSKLKKNKLKISSISLDLIMDNPLHSLKKAEVQWLIVNLGKIIEFFKIKRISIPIEERSRFNNKLERNLSLKNLKFFYSSLKNKCKICIETDISPLSLINILKIKRLKKLGILLDLGNTRAHGFSIKDYFNLYPEKIYSIHIKYRDKSYGTTKVVSKKGFYELEYLIKNINRLKNLEDISFQTYKSNKNYLNDMKKSIKNFNKYVQK